MAINSITNGNGPSPINISDNQKPAQVTPKRNEAVQGSAPVSTSDSVNLTGTASQLRSLEQTLANLPVVDVQRVDSVKREISNGTFEIDPPKIADKMIQMESAINLGLT